MLKVKLKKAQRTKKFKATIAARQVKNQKDL